MLKQLKEKREQQSAVWIIFAIAVSVFIFDALVTLILSFMPELSTPFKVLFDPIILLVFLTPALYFLLFRPLLRNISGRQLAEKHLFELNASLEALVVERTSELEQSNQMFQKENTARKQTEELLQERLQFEEIIMTLSLDFINLSSKELDLAINSALQIICKFIRADCACVFLFSKDSGKTNEINRWEANGLTALKEFPIDKLSWSTEKIKRAETILIDCMDDLPPQAAADKKEFNSFGIKSFLMIPLIHRNAVIGFLGFNTVQSEKKWEKNYVILLKIAGIIIVNALVHRWEDKKIISLKKAVETSGEVIFLTDQSGMITYVNPEFTKVYGYAASDVLMKTTPRILKSGIMDRENYKVFWETILNKQTIKGEFINKTKDGRMINIEGSANPIIDDDGGIIGFLAIQRDITERKQQELKTNG